MKYIRFIVALLFITVALALQFFCASFGWNVNFALAALVVFAFFFDFWSVLILILFSVFIINWEPAISWDLALFAAIPLLAFAFHTMFPWYRWAAAPVAIAAGLLLLYVALAPTMFFSNIVFFLEDLGGSLAFGALALWLMSLLKFP